MGAHIVMPAWKPQKYDTFLFVQIPYRPELFSGLISTTGSVVFVAARISYICFFTLQCTYMIFIYLQSLCSLIRGLETAKYLQLEAIGNGMEFQFSIDSKIKWKNIFEATSCKLIIFTQTPTKEWQLAQSLPVSRLFFGLNYSDTNCKTIKYPWNKLEHFFCSPLHNILLVESFKSKS